MLTQWMWMALTALVVGGVGCECSVAQRTLIVDNTMAAGADYPDIDVAYAASQPGDRILVRPGSGALYALPREVPHGVRIVGLGAVPVPVFGDPRIRNLPEDQIFLAHNLDFGLFPFGSSFVNPIDCRGFVLLSKFHASPRSASGTVGVFRSDHVAVTDFQFFGNQGGVHFTESRGVVADCELRPFWGSIGNVGFSSPCNNFGSEVWIVGGILSGGDYGDDGRSTFWGPDSAVFVTGQNARTYLTGGVQLFAGEDQVPLRNTPACPPDANYWYVLSTRGSAPPDPEALYVVRDPNISTRGCWRNPCGELVHEYPTAHPGDAHPGQQQVIDVIGPTNSVVSLFASLIHPSPPIELPIGDVWLDPNLVVEIGCGAVDANRDIRFTTRIPDWMEPGEALVYQVASLSPGGAWDIGPPGFAVVW